LFVVLQITIRSEARRFSPQVLCFGSILLLRKLTPRKNYIIIGIAAFLGGILTFVAIGAASYYSNQDNYVNYVNVIKTPSEQALVRMEQAGISRDQVLGFVQTWNNELGEDTKMLHTNGICNDLIQSGQANPAEFDACSTWIQTNGRARQQVMSEAAAPLSTINGQPVSGEQGAGNMTGNMSGITGNISG
jgi:hypothetical protein